RRHTRFSRDWSSDVCSSDLRVRDPDGIAGPEPDRHREPQLAGPGAFAAVAPHERPGAVVAQDALALRVREEEVAVGVARESHGRSVERRVGKECKTQGARGY